LKGFDEMALETVYIAVSAAIGLVLIVWLLNSKPVLALDAVPGIGWGMRSLRALFGLVVH
jgi:hypothetical protein